MKVGIWVLFFWVHTINICYGQPSAGRKLSSELDGLISSRYASLAPGCVVLVARNGKTVYEKAFGSANLEFNVKMTPEMVFRLGSITKEFTSTAVLQLKEQGKISLQDSIQKYIPDFPYKGSTITIENLLTHTSGIIDYENLDYHIPNTIRIDFPPKQIIDSFKTVPLEFKPGSKYNYSNSNYFLLGYIIEKITGMPYQQYLQQNIFQPIGLDNTSYENPNAIIPNRVSGYSKKDEHFRNAGYISMSQVYAAGALRSNVRDLLKWHNALNQYKVISKASLEKAVTQFKLENGELTGYGYGWLISDFEGSKLIGHGGAIDGFRTIAFHLPDQDLFIAALFNSEDDNFMNLVQDIMRAMMGKPQFKDLQLSDSILNRYVGVYKYSGTDTSVNLTIKTYKENGRLFGDLSNKTGVHMPYMAQSETKFILAIKTPTAIEFVLEKGKVVKQILIQKEAAEFTRIE